MGNESGKADKSCAITSTQLFKFLDETGGTLFKNYRGDWQYTIEKEGLEGKTNLEFSCGLHPEDALKNSCEWEEWAIRNRNLNPRGQVQS